MKQLVICLLFLFCFSDYLKSQQIRALIPYRQGVKWGYYDSTKKIIIEPKWEDADCFSEGLASVKLNGKFGYIDTLGNLIIQYKYKWVQPFYKGMTEVEYKNRCFLILNNKGKILFSKKHYGEFGILGYQENSMILYALSKDYIRMDSGKKTKRKVKGSFALYNYSMQKITPFDYAAIEKTNSERYFVVAKCNEFECLYGLYDTLLKKEIIPCSYINDTSVLFINALKQYDITYSNLKYFNGKRDERGRAIEFDIGELHFTKDTNTSEWSVKKRAQIIFKYSCDQIRNGSNNQFIVEKNDFYGVINNKGETIIPIEYKTILNVSNGLYQVKKKQSSLFDYIDMYGTKYFEE